MLKSIKNLTKAVVDITVIAAKETCHQITSANDCCTDKTRLVAWKAGLIRKSYEERLGLRKRKTLMIEYIPQEQDK
ncbi:hypothetical protein [Syntrophotalea acetylenica]|uniref:Uncharacterized protein n=1 Tax=Syntrophotalea acetylenica TaxID=29542 RepID=A0A1L3GJW9_SYNAC|nr:hypothetical protein [Syntrophotalea acetylenica]APG25958.1 hypothetical protein A7E75_13790 [Syntrophotalea acetylenica]APG44026.1 hypothetical protein A6070_07815 [Syntrophotalea acetylenica]